MNQMGDNAITLTSEITVEPIQQMGGDHMIVAAARVSTSGAEALRYADEARRDAALPSRRGAGGDALPSQRGDGGEVAGLINYLLKHRHGTPFEHAAMTFFCHAPIFVWREWHRHRVGFSYNEESGRYKQLEPVFWVPRRERLMIVPPKHKPARPVYLPLEDDAAYEALIERSRHVYQTSYDAYLADIQAGFALEVARRNLPLAIYSSCWVTCNPRSLMHFLSLRTHDTEAAFVSYPQAEIEEAARLLERIFAAGWPLAYQAFVKNGRVAP